MRAHMRIFKMNSISILLIVMLTFPVNLVAQEDDSDISNLAQFLFPEFSKSILKMKAGKDLTLMLNYNIITEKLVFLQKGKVYDLLNFEYVDTAIMNSNMFIPSGKFFLEILLDGSIPLYVEHKGKIQDPGKPAAYGGTSQVSSSNYITHLELGASGTDIYNSKLPAELIIKHELIYWVSYNNTKSKFENERQLYKIFPDKESELKKFAKQNKLKFENTGDVAKLVQYCSDLMK
jgi:hypothetical protein